MLPMSSIPQRTGIESRVMTGLAWRCRASAAAFLLMASSGQTFAADCALEPQGEGRVAAVIDTRSLRLEDGREVRLAGIAHTGTDRASGRAALSAIAGGREVTLHGEDDSPDRYGRQGAFVFVTGSEHSVQSEMMRRGEALFSADIADKNCAAALAAAEGAARDAKLGIWDHRHKKRGKSRRYSVRGWALYRGGGQSTVRSAVRGNHLPEFRAELDTGLCCDYFKAHHSGVRERRPWS
jgi:endonuclease YncB( thermonuclease family)